MKCSFQCSAVSKVERHFLQTKLAISFHGWKDVDLIVRSNEIEVDEDDLNEGFCHYSIINDDE